MAVGLTNMGRITLTKAAINLLGTDTDRVELLWDKSKGKLGIRSEPTGHFRINYNAQKNAARLSASSFLNHIGYDWSTTQLYEAEWDLKAKLLAVELPSERFGTTKKLVRPKTKGAPKETP